ncbi:MAG TPA: glycosyltransferase family 4 protein [Nitrosopumilaceae archaeon]|nr:glycosyltransferase family 4 protein [Nitrosopumilaceae archaeon]
MYCIVTQGRISESVFGEEGYALSLGRWLREQNLNVVIIGSKFLGVKVNYLPNLEMTKDKKNNGKGIVVNAPYAVYMLSKIFFSLLCIVKILSINMSTPIRLIHALDSGYSGLAAVITGKILKIPVIVDSHGIRHRTLTSTLKGRLGKILLKLEYNLDIFTLKSADSTMGSNSEIKDYYEKILGKTVEYMPTPLKLKNFTFSQTDRDLIRKELGIDDQTKIVGFVGRLSPEKNLITLLDSFKEVIQDHPFLKLVLVGTGLEEFHLKEEAKRQHIEDKIIFCGYRTDISRILSSFDIFVLPSYTEGMSSALQEAMSCGCAIICSDIPANRVLITHSKEGLLINPYNSHELKDAIGLLSTDDSLRSKLGNNAKIKAEQFDESIIFPTILRHYLRLTKKETN